MNVARTILGERSSGRRKVLALAVLLLFLLLIRLVWGAWSGRKAREALAALRGRGEAIEAADVVYPIVPDEQNAWELQLKAARGGMPTSPRHTNDEFPDYPPYPDKWMQLSAASETANATTFALARQARQLSHVRHRAALTSPVWAMLLRPLNNAKILANTLADGIAYAHVSGDDGEAIERSLDLLHLARSIRHDDFVVSQLVAIGIEALARAQIQSMAPGLRLDAKSATRPATAAQVRRLIDVLLDEREAREGLIRTVAVERIMYLDLVRSRAEGSWAIRPLADQALVRGLPSFDALDEGFRAESMPAARRALAGFRWEEFDGPFPPPGSPARRRSVGRYARWFDGDRMAAAAVAERQFRVLTDRRATAASLACQLFRAERGRWPERLEELVPAYLPHVPADPFLDDGRWIGYLVLHGVLPDGGDRPLLYWHEATMDFGPPATPTYGWYIDSRWKPGIAPIYHRQYRDVSRFVLPPSTPPSP